MSKMSTMFRSVSYGPCSRTGVTCVASDFGRDNLIVDGRQMVFLVSVHGSIFFHGHWVSCGPAMISYSYWFI